MKALGFEKLNAAEKNFCFNILSRCKIIKGTEREKIVSKLTVAWIVQNPWVCVLLKNGKKHGVGFAKCATYAPMKDEWDEEVGGRIALSRAVRDMLGK